MEVVRLRMSGPSMLIWLLGLLLPLAISCAPARPKALSSDSSLPRFILHPDRNTPISEPSNIKDNFSFTAQRMLSVIAAEVNRIIGYTPQQLISISVLDKHEFALRTGAPDWTSAMYFRGEIILPYDGRKPTSFSDLHRALRHEYTHALIAEISHYRCPAWLDEGLAQIVEGSPNQLLGPTLRSWINENESLPLDWLIPGFTLLDEEIVPVAYGQSLFVTRHLLNSKGMNAIRFFLDQLAQNTPEDEAFNRSFKRELKTFDRSLTAMIRRWAQSSNVNP